MEKSKSSINRLRRFLHFLRPHWTLVLRGFFFMFLSILLGLPMPLLTMYLIDTVIKMKNFTVLNIVGIVLIGVIIVRSISSYLQRYFTTHFRGKVIFDVRKKVFEHIQNLELAFFKDRETGYLVSRIHSDVEALNTLLGDTILGFIRDTLTFLVGVILIFWIHKGLAIITVSILPLFVISILVFNKRIRNMSRDVRERYALVQRDLQEALSGIELIKAFTGEELSSRKVMRTVREAIDQNIRLDLFSALAGITSTLLSSIAPLALVWYGIGEIMRGSLTLGGLVAFNSFIRYLFGPTERLLNLNFMVQRGLASLDRVSEILELRPKVKEKENARELHLEEGKIEFVGVSFSYDSGERVLEDLSFEINPKERVAIVGRSGVGKTTLVNLLLRFYDPDKGKILIDGVDIRDVTFSSLRNSIGFVSQDVFLFSTSILENIRFAKPSATLDEVIYSAKLARAHRFIEKLPEGYNTKIGERGVRLSGGQRQRLAIARALLKDPKILIFDEAMSQVDTETEREIQEALLAVTKGRTVIIIAHRLSSILYSDKVLVLEGGKIVGYGTHRELLEVNPLYQRLFEELKSGLGV